MATKADKLDNLLDGLEEYRTRRDSEDSAYLDSYSSQYKLKYMIDDLAECKLPELYAGVIKKVEGVWRNPLKYGFDHERSKKICDALGPYLGCYEEDGQHDPSPHTDDLIEGLYFSFGRATRPLYEEDKGKRNSAMGYMRIGLERTLPVILDRLAEEPDRYSALLDEMAGHDIITDKQAEAAKDIFKSTGMHFQALEFYDRPFDITMSLSAYIVGSRMREIPEDLFVKAFGCDFEGKAVDGVMEPARLESALGRVKRISEVYAEMDGAREAIDRVSKEQKAHDKRRAMALDLMRDAKGADAVDLDEDVPDDDMEVEA